MFLDTPEFICEKFKTGFPVTWQRDICLWVDYEMRNRPTDYFLPYTLNRPLKYLSTETSAATTSSQRDDKASELMPAPSAVPKQMKFSVYFPHIQSKTIRKNQMAASTKGYQLATTKHNSLVTSTPIVTNKATSKFTFNEISHKKQHGGHENGNDNDVDNISNSCNITNISDEALLQITKNPNENSLNCSEILSNSNSNSKSNSKLKTIRKNRRLNTSSMTLRSHSRSINNNSSGDNYSSSSTRKREPSTSAANLTITNTPSSSSTTATTLSLSANKRAKLNKLSEPNEKPKTQRKAKIASPVKEVNSKKITKNKRKIDETNIIEIPPLSEFKKPLKPAPKPANKIFKKVAPKPSAVVADSELSRNTTSSSTITGKLSQQQANNFLKRGGYLTLIHYNRYFFYKIWR